MGDEIPTPGVRWKKVRRVGRAGVAGIGLTAEGKQDAKAKARVPGGCAYALESDPLFFARALPTRNHR